MLLRETNTRRKLAVLHAEDCASDSELLEAHLRRAGYDLTLLRVDSRAAMEKALAETSWDIVISDYHLPGFGGDQALELLQRSGRDIPFLLLSGAIGETAAVDAMRAGVHDYIVKDNLARLVPAIERELRDVEVRRERRRSEERFAAFMRNLPGIAFMKDRDGRYVFVNETAERTFGRPAREWLGKASDELWPRSVAVSLRENHDIVLRTGQTLYSVLDVPGDGGDRSWLAVEFPIVDVDGTTSLTGSLGIDITESRRQEEERTALLEVAADISDTLDLQEILSRVHRRAAALLHCDRLLTYEWDGPQRTFRLLAQHGTPDEIASRATAFAFPSDDTSLLLQSHTVVVNDLRTQSAVPAEWLEPYDCTAFVAATLIVRGAVVGAIVAVRTGGAPGFDPRTVQLFEGIARQVALAMGMVESYRLKEEEARVSGALARVGHELIASLDTATLLAHLGRVTAEALECESSYTALFDATENAYTPVSAYGYTPEEWETLRVLRVPRTLIADRVDALQENGLVLVSPERDLFRAALPRWRAASPSPSLWIAVHRDDEVVGIHAATFAREHNPLTPVRERIARGIGQRASLALQNARLMEELDRANRLKSDFVATMSHELRTPLNVILGYNDLVLEGEFGPITEEQSGALRRVDKSARELLELINATLDLSRLDAGGVPVALAEVSVPDLLAAVDADTASWRESSKLRFVWDISPDLPPIPSDPAKLKVVLKNLIGNAVKFTERGQVTVSAYPRGDDVEISVADTGIGMAPEVMQIIFEPFRQGESAMTRRFSGVGLGLYIVQRLVGLLGGRIEVESEVGHGSTFRIRLPRQPS